MKRLASVITTVGSLLMLTACLTAPQSEGDRLQSVGEHTLDGIDTTGLDALQ